MKTLDFYVEEVLLFFNFHSLSYCLLFQFVNFPTQ